MRISDWSSDVCSSDLNYKLAEALKDHARDLLLLSATPHQGNHFQFWMLIQLLNPTLFNTPEEMVENRHRLNTVMYRRTKADACQPDGRSEEHTSELQSLMRISYAVFCLKKKNT